MPLSTPSHFRYRGTAMITGFLHSRTGVRGLYYLTGGIEVFVRVNQASSS